MDDSILTPRQKRRGALLIRAEFAAKGRGQVTAFPSVAQPGSASALGAEGRWFKSSFSDQFPFIGLEVRGIPTAAGLISGALLSQGSQVVKAPGS